MNQPVEVAFVDSNIPMYALGRDHPYRAACHRLLASIEAGEIEATTSTEVHQEILHRYLSLRLPAWAAEASARFETLIPNVLPVTLPDIRQARALAPRYELLPARDLLHVAVMLNNGIATIVSADRHFDQVAEIVRLDPVQWVAAGSG